MIRARGNGSCHFVVKVTGRSLLIAPTLTMMILRSAAEVLSSTMPTTGAAPRQAVLRRAERCGRASVSRCDAEFGGSSSQGAA